MTDQIYVDEKQLALLMGASLLTDAFIQPFGRQSDGLSAQMGILSAVVQCLGFFVIFLILQKYSNAILQTRWGCGIFAVGLLLSATLEMIQGERFYSYVMDEKLSIISFLLIVFLCVFYGVYSGVDTVSRTASIILALTGVSIAFLVVSIFPQLRFVNLQPSALDFSKFVNVLKQQVYIPPELIIWVLILKQSQNRSTRKTGPVFALLFTANALFYLLGEMTLGDAYRNQEQPLFTIARLGGISVFRRLDALHISVWLLLFLLKITLYFSIITMLLKKIWPCLKKHVPYYLASIGAIVIFLLTWSQLENTAYFIQQGILLTVIVLMLMPIPKKEKMK